jgi:AraC family transcriptional regulator of adaptative response / DNA-3-methyladenine glycosylase II
MVASFGRKFNGPKGLTHLFPSPDALAKAMLESVGLTGARAETIRALARAVSDGKIKFEGVIDSEHFSDRLCEIPGIGAWTAQYVAMRALREPDAFPSSDLGLLRASSVSTSRELEQRSEPWRPWRAYSAMYLWRMDGDRSAMRSAERQRIETARLEAFHAEQVVL